MGYRLVKIIETSNLFLIVNMTRYRTKAIILCDGRNIVLSIVLPDSTKAPTTVKLEVQLRHRLPPSLERSGKGGGRRW